jgi:hypothetical protein
MMLEDVGDAESSGQAFDPAFEQLQVGSVSQAYRVETISFGSRYVARSRAALGIGILMMADQRLPVNITGSLD